MKLNLEKSYEFVDEPKIKTILNEEKLNSTPTYTLPQEPDFVMYLLIGIPLISLVIVLYLIYRKYRTRTDYDQSPESFSRKPELSVFQNYHLNNLQFKSLSLSDGQQIQRKQTTQGLYDEITFKTHKNCIYYQNQLRSSAYFQMEIIKLNSILEIGFIHKEELKQIYKEVDGEMDISLDKRGVSLNTDGQISLYGHKMFNFKWELEFGDVIGIGITEKEKRVWISKNGKLLNPPNGEEIMKNLNIENEEIREKGDFQQDNKKLEIQFEEDKNYEKKKIQLKTTKSFKYYAVIISERGDAEPSIINVNLGGQIFRMYENELMGGILI